MIRDCVDYGRGRFRAWKYCKIQCCPSYYYSLAVAQDAFVLCFLTGKAYIALNASKSFLEVGGQKQKVVLKYTFRKI